MSEDCKIATSTAADSGTDKVQSASSQTSPTTTIRHLRLKAEGRRFRAFSLGGTSREPFRGADSPQYMQCLSITIPNNFSCPDQPLEAAVLPYDTVLKCQIGARLIHRLAHHMRHRLPILPTHKC